MRKAALGAVICSLVLAFATPAYAAFPSEEDRVPAPGLNCLERVQLPDLVNVIDAKWSPDGADLAIVRFERRPASNTSGYLEDEVLEIVNMRAKRVIDIGTIEYGRPAWSPSGRYLAYWGYKADFLEVMERRTGEVVAKLTPSNPDFHWRGDDTLVFIEKSTIRAWTGGKTPETLGRLGETKVPHYPEDNWDWSGDGTRFTLTRYDQKDAIPERFLGTTASADAEPLDLPGALYTEWAPSGSVLLARYPARLDVRDLVAGTTAQIPIARGAIHQWGPDGRTLMVRSPKPTVAAGDVYEQPKIVWPVASGAAILPDVFGVRAFSPNGRYFSGTIRTDRHDNLYTVFRCYDIVRGDPKSVPVAFDDRFAKIDGGTGHLIRPVAGSISQFFHPAHTGVDVAAPFGTPVVAADAGVVTKTGWQDDGEGGIRVCVQHAGGLETCYYHVSTILVTVGQRVARGEAIAIVGMSGRTNGPHVHWEAKLNGRVIDPLLR